MTKVLCFGDLHANKFSDFSEADNVTGNSRLTSIIACLAFMREYCIKNNIKYVLDAGDLFHKRGAVDTEVFNFVFDEIRKFSDAGINVIMIPGNHNQYSNEDFPQHSIEQFKEIKNVTVLDRFTPHKLDSGDWVFPVPYSKNAELVKKAIDKYAYDTVNEGIERSSILLGHLGVSGAFVGKSSYAMSDAFTVEDLMPHAFQFVVLGHFHKYQDLGGHSHVFYTGAPIQHNFNDEGQEKGCWVIDTETKEKELVVIPSPKFITVKEWKTTDPTELEGNFVRFQVPPEDVEELSESLPETSKHRLEVQKTYEEDRRVDVDFSMSFDEIVTKYAEEFKPEAKEVGLEILREALTR